MAINWLSYPSKLYAHVRTFAVRISQVPTAIDTAKSTAGLALLTENGVIVQRAVTGGVEVYITRQIIDEHDVFVAGSVFPDAPNQIALRLRNVSEFTDPIYIDVAPEIPQQITTEPKKEMSDDFAQGLLFRDRWTVVRTSNGAVTAGKWAVNLSSLDVYNDPSVGAEAVIQRVQSDVFRGDCHVEFRSVQEDVRRNDSGWRLGVIFFDESPFLNTAGVISMAQAYGGQAWFGINLNGRGNVFPNDAAGHVHTDVAAELIAAGSERWGGDVDAVLAGGALTTSLVTYSVDFDGHAIVFTVLDAAGTVLYTETRRVTIPNPTSKYWCAVIEAQAQNNGPALRHHFYTDRVDCEADERVVTHEVATSGGGLPAVVQANQGTPTTDANAWPTKTEGLVQSLPAPNPGAILGTTPTPEQLEPDHALRTRARVLTDEDSFYEDFPGASLATAIVGNVTLTNLSTAWSRAAATTPLKVGQYIYITAHTYTAAAQIDTIAAGGLSGTLRTAYTGATATAAASVQNWIQTIVTAAAAHTVTVAASALVLTMIGAASAANDSVCVARGLGAGGRKSCQPVRERFTVAIDNRRANQNTLIGVLNAPTLALATQGSYIMLAGADAQTQVRLTTFSAVGVQQQRTVTLPNGDHTDNPEAFEIDVRPDRVAFYANNFRLGDPLWYHLPDVYEPMYLVIAMFDNNVVGGDTVVSVDQIESLEENLLQVQSEQLDETKLRATTIDATPNGPAAGVSTAIAVNAVVNCGATVAGQRYRVSIVGGAGICVRVDATDPVVTDEVWFDGQKVGFIATVTSATGVRCIKRTAWTADAACILTAIV